MTISSSPFSLLLAAARAEGFMSAPLRQRGNEAERSAVVCGACRTGGGADL